MLSVYIWGIFLAYTLADSRRDSVFMYFGKRGVTALDTTFLEAEWLKKIFCLNSISYLNHTSYLSLY